VDEIRKFFCGVANMDMHSGNGMEDALGNIIITDPISFSPTIESRSMRAGIERAYGLQE
jgi:hypothetical protein